MRHRKWDSSCLSQNLSHKHSDSWDYEGPDKELGFLPRRQLKASNRFFLGKSYNQMRCFLQSPTHVHLAMWTGGAGPEVRRDREALTDLTRASSRSLTCFGKFTWLFPQDASSVVLFQRSVSIHWSSNCHPAVFWLLFKTLETFLWDCDIEGQRWETAGVLSLPCRPRRHDRCFHCPGHQESLFPSLVLQLPIILFECQKSPQISFSCKLAVVGFCCLQMKDLNWSSKLFKMLGVKKKKIKILGHWLNITNK